MKEYHPSHPGSNDPSTTVYELVKVLLNDSKLSSIKAASKDLSPKYYNPLYRFGRSCYNLASRRLGAEIEAAFARIGIEL